MGHIYTVQSGDYHKIGIAADVGDRLKSFQTSSPYDLLLVHSFETDQPREAEAFLHRIFKHKRIKGEWFLLSDTDLNFIKSIGGFLDGSFAWLSRPVPKINTGRPEEATKIFSAQYREDRPAIVFTEKHLSDFIQVTWHRQQEGKHGLSRRYWTEHRRPPLHKVAYMGMVQLLIEANLIINRKPGAAGYLAVPPEEAMRTILNTAAPTLTS